MTQVTCINEISNKQHHVLKFQCHHCNGVPNTGGVVNNCRFSTNVSPYFRNGTTYSHRYYKMRQGLKLSTVRLKLALVHSPEPLPILYQSQKAKTISKIVPFSVTSNDLQPQPIPADSINSELPLILWNEWSQRLQISQPKCPAPNYPVMVLLQA